MCGPYDQTNISIKIMHSPYGTKEYNNIRPLWAKQLIL